MTSSSPNTLAQNQAKYQVPRIQNGQDLEANRHRTLMGLQRQPGKEQGVGAGLKYTG